MTKCLICDSDLEIEKLHCKSCHTDYTGRFFFPPLARLKREERMLAEALILHGGNLKEMTQTLDISYPTLKKRLNDLAVALEAKKAEDKAHIDTILDAMEKGEMSPEEGIKLIREINGEL